MWGRSPIEGRRPVLLIALAASGFAYPDFRFREFTSASLSLAHCAGRRRWNCRCYQAYVADSTDPKDRAALWAGYRLHNLVSPWSGTWSFAIALASAT